MSLRIFTILAILLTAATVASGDIHYLVTFEGGGQYTQIHPETGGLVPGTPIRFASEWVTVTSGPFANNPSGTTITIFVGGNAGEVTFDEPVSHVGVHYSAGGQVTLLAYDANGAEIDSVSAPPNIQPDGFTQWDPIEVSANGENLIARVVLMGYGGSTAIDDFSAVVETDIEVNIDLKLQHNIDNLNLNSAKHVEVAVLSTPDFDATTLDVTTAALGDPALGVTIPAIASWPEDYDNDGIMDQVFDFGMARDMGDAGAVNCYTTEVRFTAEGVFGTNPVQIQGCNKNHTHCSLLITDPA